MNSRLQGLMTATGILTFAAVVALAIIGCGGVNPFLSTAFWNNSTLTQRVQPNVTSFQQQDTTQLTSVCNLDAAQPTQGTIQITVMSDSQQYVKFSMMLLASAGAGGFVCDNVLQEYLDAGYSDVTGNVVGCDTIALGGTRLLGLEFGINQGNAARLPPATYVNGVLSASSTLTLLRRDVPSPYLPLPQTIVFGNDDPEFECVGGAGTGGLCTQRGFVYTSAADVVVGKSVEASRIQGTRCNTGFGSLPEWQLDTTINDGLTQPFQYAFGGTIVVRVLDRSSDPTTTSRNQAVWTVTNNAGATIHSESP